MPLPFATHGVSMAVNTQCCFLLPGVQHLCLSDTCTAKRLGCCTLLFEMLLHSSNRSELRRSK